MLCCYWLDLDHSLAPLALLCHKEPAHGTQSPLLGVFLAFRWSFIACIKVASMHGKDPLLLPVVLYGIRVLVEQSLESNLDLEWTRQPRFLLHWDWDMEGKSRYWWSHGHRVSYWARNTFLVYLADKDKCVVFTCSHLESAKHETITNRFRDLHQRQIYITTVNSRTNYFLIRPPGSGLAEDY